MAMYFPDMSTTQDDIKAAFDHAREEGESHLLVLAKTHADMDVTPDSLFLASVGKPDDIVDVLRRENEGNSPYVGVKLCKVYDVNQSFDLQMDLSNAAGPLAPAFYFLDRFDAKMLQAAIDVVAKNYNDRQEYQKACIAHEGRPLLKRAFEAIFRINSEPREPRYSSFHTGPKMYP